MTLTVRLCDVCAVEIGKRFDVSDATSRERQRSACAFCRKFDRLLQFKIPFGELA